MDASNLFSALRTFLTPTPDIKLAAHSDGEQQVALVPQGYSLKSLPPATQKRPDHRFFDLGSFAAYLIRRASPDTADIVINATTAVASFNAYDKTAPTVHCAMLHHPDWQAWDGILGKRLTVKQLFDFCRTIPATLPPLPGRRGGETLPQWEALQAELSKLKLVTSEDMSVEIDVRGMVTASGGTSKATLQANLPATLKARVPLYDEVYITDGLDCDTEPELAVYDLEVLLEATYKKGEGLFFTLRAPRRKQIERKALRDAVAWVEHLLGNEDWLVGVGDSRTTEVTLPLGHDDTSQAA